MRGVSRIQRGRLTPAHQHFGSATSRTRTPDATPGRETPKGQQQQNARSNRLTTEGSRYDAPFDRSDRGMRVRLALSPGLRQPDRSVLPCLRVGGALSGVPLGIGLRGEPKGRRLAGPGLSSAFGFLSAVSIACWRSVAANASPASSRWTNAIFIRPIAVSKLGSTLAIPSSQRSRRHARWARRRFGTGCWKPRLS